MIVPLPEGHEKASPDVVTRTATAVLAGYFISKNFISKKTSVDLEKSQRTRMAFQTTAVGIIGLFSLALILVIRYAYEFNFSSTNLSLVRDLYLASVAFLMGTNQNYKKVLQALSFCFPNLS